MHEKYLTKDQTTAFEPTEQPHRRYNPLSGQWILVYPHRAKRPWQVQAEDVSRELLPNYAGDCYLCSGNKRISGERNSAYKSTFVFTNDFTALTQETHDYSKALPELSTTAIRSVVDVWVKQLDSLKADYAWVQVFENKGDVMGCSHPHDQVWVNSFLPNEIYCK